MLCYAANMGDADFIGSDFSKEQSKGMGLVKTRRLAAMQKQQRAKAGMRPPCKDRKVPVPRAKFSSAPRRP